MKPGVVADEMFPDGSGAYMELDESGGATGILMDLAANEKCLHADFYNAPKINNYVLKDGNITCARLQLNISAKIPYDEVSPPPPAAASSVLTDCWVQANKTTGVYELNPGTDMVMMPSSTCNGPNNTEVIHLLVAGKHHLNIVLLKNKDKVSLSLELHYSQKDMENATNPDDEYSVISKDIWSVPASRSYQCNSEVSVTLSPELNITGAHEVVAKLWDVRYMAYVNQTTDNYNQEWPCDQDTQMADIVPIAVGVALAALVVVVVIAYTVSRRRTKQRGYQSV
ncbi:LAMP1 [Cordylochernes scorpioides]|uniref:LAMP1 n=1 Tax=Cordylochernes scorpioides TaxID=51811 RepID=A0ABY6KMW9_9ARAC|nr:LAMP1 [Cordylochernes scorpioides]